MNAAATTFHAAQASSMRMPRLTQPLQAVARSVLHVLARGCETLAARQARRTADAPRDVDRQRVDGLADLATWRSSFGS